MNGILNIYKEKGMTSFDVIAKLRKKLGIKKIGHAGTLDPMATGVLVVAIGSATKALNFLDVSDKIYTATCLLGQLTHSGDITGQVIEHQEIIPFSQETLNHALRSLTGKMSQRVPKVSAKKIAGKRSYDYVLDNEEVPTLYTDIEIFQLEALTYSGSEIIIRAHVSNGTYMRTLCEDLAVALGNIGTMSELVRNQVGKFHVDDAQTLDNLDVSRITDVKSNLKIPLVFDESLNQIIEHGKRIAYHSDCKQIVFDSGHYFSVYELEKEGIYKPIRGLW